MAIHGYAPIVLVSIERTNASELMKYGSIRDFKMVIAFVIIEGCSMQKLKQRIRKWLNRQILFALMMERYFRGVFVDNLLGFLLRHPRVRNLLSAL